MRPAAAAVRRFARGLAALSAALFPALAHAGTTEDGVHLFESKIRPALIESCYACHSGQPGAKIKGELRLDTKAGLAKGGSSGKPLLVAGNPDKSLLIEAIRYHDDDLLMPPKAKLAEDVIRDFERWVKLGAPDPRTEEAAPAAEAHPSYKPPAADSAEARAHWSFQPVRPATPPSVQDGAWVKSDVDRFVLAKLEAAKIRPVAAADKRTLLRRATFDLTGLPPTPQELDAFLADASPNAFASVVERLLASPAYGERWGRHWLDVVRYADTAGESADYPVPQAYRYRDYVIAAFNHDKPYDQFVREQIAGDLLPYTSETQHYEQIVATGFIATARRFGVSPESQQYLTIEDTIDTTGKAFLGLSLSCARCHDHKFDPIPTSDYYGLYGIFDSTRYPFPGSENTKRQKDFVPLLPDAEVQRVLGPTRAQVQALYDQIKDLKSEEAKLEADADKAKVRSKMKALGQQAANLLASGPQVADAYAVGEGEEIGDARIQRRGEPKDLTDVAPRGFLTVLGGQKLPKDFAGSGRLQLAGWLSDAANPLTARVMVNRIWQHHFGKGLVSTSNDFGARGAKPTHPELLDYLADQFVQQGWSVKAMHRLIMLSSTYQLASTDDEDVASLDPNNDLHWRYDRQRLEAEEIRDAMLAVSGTLDAQPPAGPHPFPPKDKWAFTQHAPFTAVYDNDHRSVYLMVQRIRRHPFLATFDGADPNASTGDRIASTTPLQALFAMNDPFVHRTSNALADRVRALSPDESRQVVEAFKLTLSREPLPEEVASAGSYLREFGERLKADDKTQGSAAQADATAKAAMASLCRVLLGSNEFMFVD